MRLFQEASQQPPASLRVRKLHIKHSLQHPTFPRGSLAPPSHSSKVQFTSSTAQHIGPALCSVLIRGQWRSERCICIRGINNSVRREQNRQPTCATRFKFIASHDEQTFNWESTILFSDLEWARMMSPVFAT